MYHELRAHVRISLEEKGGMYHELRDNVKISLEEKGGMYRELRGHVKISLEEKRDEVLSKDMLINSIYSNPT